MQEVVPSIIENGKSGSNELVEIRDFLQKAQTLAKNLQESEVNVIHAKAHSLVRHVHVTSSPSSH
jgi:hypothetical protein